MNGEMLFFHPVVRLAARRSEESAEAACDRALVRGEKDVVDYTACLLSIVERCSPGRPRTAPLGLSATQTQIQRRISRLLGLKSGELAPLGRRHRWLLLPAILLMLCGFSLASQPQGEPHQTARPWTKRGITYTPLAAVLLKALVDPESKVATLDALERTDEEIEVEFQTDGSLGSRLGGGVSGSWSGYIHYQLGSGTLRLDAKTLMPIELTSTFHDQGRRKETVVTERLSEPVEVDPGHWVPLRVEAVRHERERREGQVVDEGTCRFDWTFRVYQGGVWLFDAEPAGEGTAIGYHLEDVQIGDSAKPVAQASSAAVAAIQTSKGRARKIVDQYVEVNRAWLLPDLEKRQGLVYDYVQEDGYRERVFFDLQGNILAHLKSGRQTKGSPSGDQHLFTADGREARGTADESFLKGRPFDPASTNPFSSHKRLHNLATGWGWECASMRLARAADDLGVELEESADGNTRKLILRPVRNKPTLHERLAWRRILRRFHGNPSRPLTIPQRSSSHSAPCS